MPSSQDRHSFIKSVMCTGRQHIQHQTYHTKLFACKENVKECLSCEKNMHAAPLLSYPEADDSIFQSKLIAIHLLLAAQM